MLPAQIVVPDGFDETEGAAFTVSVAVFDVADGEQLPETTQSNVLPSSPVTEEMDSVVVVTPEYTPVLLRFELFFLH